MQPRLGNISPYQEYSCSQKTIQVNETLTKSNVAKEIELWKRALLFKHVSSLRWRHTKIKSITYLLWCELHGWKYSGLLALPVRIKINNTLTLNYRKKIYVSVSSSQIYATKLCKDIIVQSATQTTSIQTLFKTWRTISKVNRQTRPVATTVVMDPTNP